MNKKNTQSEQMAPKPSKLLLLMEGRAMLDAASMMPMWLLKKYLPLGDGHPVLTLPGFMTSSKTTIPLRQFVAKLGYASHRWKLGFNTGYSHQLHEQMVDRVIELTERYEAKVSLVGWSLGGVYARELARDIPEYVRQVITMGSPFRAHPRSTNVSHLFEFFSEIKYEDMHEDFLQRMAKPPPVPTTALYTRGDGIVAWQCTVEQSERVDVENIHVGGAHTGLGFNFRSWYAIADRLAQPDGGWQRFSPPWYLRQFYTDLYPDWLVGDSELSISAAGD